MLDIWGKNIRNMKLTIKSFLEGYQFVLKRPSIRLDASLGSWYYTINGSNDLIFIEASTVSFHGAHLEDFA